MKSSTWLDTTWTQRTAGRPVTGQDGGRTSSLIAPSRQPQIRQQKPLLEPRRDDRSDQRIDAPRVLGEVRRAVAAARELHLRQDGQPETRPIQPIDKKRQQRGIARQGQ